MQKYNQIIANKVDGFERQAMENMPQPYMFGYTQHGMTGGSFPIARFGYSQQFSKIKPLSTRMHPNGAEFGQPATNAVGRFYGRAPRTLAQAESEDFALANAYPRTIAKQMRAHPVGGNYGELSDSDDDDSGSAYSSDSDMKSGAGRKIGGKRGIMAGIAHDIGLGLAKEGIKQGVKALIKGATSAASSAATSAPGAIEGGSRADVVRQIMQTYPGMTIGEASRYVKEHGWYKKKERKTRQKTSRDELMKSVVAKILEDYKSRGIKPKMTDVFRDAHKELKENYQPEPAKKKRVYKRKAKAEEPAEIEGGRWSDERRSMIAKAMEEHGFKTQKKANRYVMKQNNIVHESKPRTSKQSERNQAMSAKIKEIKQEYIRQGIEKPDMKKIFAEASRALKKA